MAEPVASEHGARVLTVPNVLSLLRLAGVPLFLYLLLGPRADGWAILVLAVGGVTDWLDGKLARLLNQQSRLGALLDPAVDRLYILAALVALGARAGHPVVGGGGADRPGPRARRDPAGAAAAEGMARTRSATSARARPSCCSMPSRCCCSVRAVASSSDLARPVGIAFAIWGTAVYLYSGLLYLAQFVLALRQGTARDPRGPSLHHCP